MAKEILTDDGKLEESDMEEAKDDNKKLGMPAIDDEEGREDSEEDGEGGTSRIVILKLKSLMLLQKPRIKKQRKKKMTKITKMMRKMTRKK